jgi:DNA primase
VRYPPAILDEIRARLPVSAVVGKRVRMKKAGREWRGLSPFNAEKTPSFFVNDQKGFFHCFSSGKHGDIFTFVMETDGLSFPEAVEELAAEAGVPLPKPSPEAELQERKRKDLSDVVDLACRFFEGQLQTSKGQAAREYLKNREISVETQAEFRIGYAPDSRTALLDHLRSQSIGDDQIVAAGLAIEPDDGRGLYDRFRGRVIIPIEDATGRVVAFGGRALSPEVQPKYLNSPETELFKKGEVVFNWHRARRAAHQTGSAIVVEGYLDAIAVFQAGMRSVVATLGTAFTERQIKELWRLAPEPVICFDGDNAGRTAAYRALDRILPDLETGWSFRFGFLPAGQDPDDLIRSQGKEAFRHVIDEALPMWDVLWAREVDAANLGTPDGQAVLEKRLGDLIGTIKDQRLRRLYGLRAKVSLSDLFWRHERGKFARSRPKTDVALPTTNEFFFAGPARQSGLERIFLGLCIEFPDWALDAHERLAAITLRGSSKGTDDEPFTHQRFADGLVDLITTETVATAQEMYRRLDPVFSGALDYLHGRDTADRAMGHRLRDRLPVLKLNPSPDFLERCFWHFLRMLELREMQDVRDELVKRPPAAFDEDLLHEVESVQAEVMILRDRVNADENDLAEEAQAFRSPSGGRVPVAGLAA